MFGIIPGMQNTEFNDTESCKTAATDTADWLSVVAQKDQCIQAQEKQITDQQHLIAEQQQLIQLLRERLNLARQKRFAASSEKMPFQIDFFDEAELEMALSDIDAQLPAEHLPPASAKPRAPREGFSDKLPRVRVELTLTAEEKAGAVRTWFSKVKEELNIIPAKAEVIEYWQEKAAFPETDSGEQPIKSATRPVHPLGKCVASVTLLAWILVSKYADALPLYRQEGILSRHDARFSRTTLANWIIRLGTDVLLPLINLMREAQLASDYLQLDETRLQVLNDSGKAATSDNWMWLIRGGPPDQPAVIFEYDASRSGEVPARLLDGFRGVLQADGYAGYNQICASEGITRIGCWDHVRRKFVDASKAAPTQKSNRNKASKADVAISKIRKLYLIEDCIRALPPEQKQHQRQQLSKPLLDDFHQWLQANQNRIPKDSLTYEAIRYALNQWPTLTGYCEDGRLHISNALAENAIRPFAVGRRNWLFADTARGAKASATCYSLIETAKANGLEPLSYIEYVLRRIGEADTVEKLEALLPWNVKTAMAVV
jgi:transposase